MRNLIFLPVLICFALCTSRLANAQNPKDELTQLMIDDSMDINAIALYPQATRENIFKVSAHSEGIVKLDDAQKKSQESFRNLIASYSKDEQQKIWNLTRYNDLISQLAATKGKKKKVEDVLKSFPADVHNDALEYAVNHKDLIASLDKMNKDFNAGFQNIVSGYSQDDQKAFREMLNTPEAFSLLSKNMHMTVHLGNIYQSDAAMMRQQFDSLNLVLAEQKAKENEEWKKEMKDNPDAQKEMKESADEYEKENQSAGGTGEKDYANTDPVVVEHYVLVPYPYWCGYPYWYTYDYWYPYPYWYHTGFYYHNGEMIWMGPPSWYFVHWHFHHHPHYYHYPHLTNVYINHYYYGPRRVISRNRVEVHTWMRNNENSLPRDFKANNEQRIDRIRELGKADTDLDNFHNNNPGKNLTRDEFIKQHQDEYPHLKQPVAIEKENPRKSDVVPVERPREQQKHDIERPKSTPREIKREPTRPVIKEPVQIKSQPQTPVPKTKPEQPRKPQVTPKRVPAAPAVPAEQKKDKKNSGRK